MLYYIMDEIPAWQIAALLREVNQSGNGNPSMAVAGKRGLYLWCKDMPTEVEGRWSALIQKVRV